MLSWSIILTYLLTLTLEKDTFSGSEWSDWSKQQERDAKSNLPLLTDPLTNATPKNLYIFVYIYIFFKWQPVLSLCLNFCDGCSSYHEPTMECKRFQNCPQEADTNEDRVWDHSIKENFFSLSQTPLRGNCSLSPEASAEQRLGEFTGLTHICLAMSWEVVN